ncbi:hypothetical protein PHIM7_332 [Sinorhizobium phage phiM7]|uniref:Uncharacterized protein n=3 Tax=Emdodecavirus TaxID=1980937 RepID=S5MBR5_9CAUD|nr:hypothetical protein AB690_gp182 [Sinorhizobium phage phiM12]YP_009212577.1 hypothetical protein AVT40_gp196 [Sinorhizobium phage phiN3]YP_009601457.1 hypothetical protein FDH46_gp146 [Sinorhizobium phage phiM7]AKF13237.1 hypothetical protein PHIM19_332 [Sinorhizobium phage phiM19]AGR48058.1 hypothetical protein SmphiM12_426 [Sinorhizobium phage phiM12]AKF12877.1 hypothetical protein PHIM7_332 [Sinorhizobium phage phiM7]AKF13600.1 hypothetical protein PHIN3_337 [Sinorhizobium phage phiN3]
MSESTYIGTFLMELDETPFEQFTPADWAMYFIQRYGQFDGPHHKAWVLDQVARILKGTPVIISQARWTDHDPEWRIYTATDPSDEYKVWRRLMLGDWDEDTQEFEYGYDEGIAP